MQNAIDQNVLPKTDLYLFGRGEARKAYLTFGCHPLPPCEGHPDGAHVFGLWAPRAASVSVVGDFNKWDPKANPMHRESDEFWSCVVDGLKNGDTYKYRIVTRTGEIRLKADPFAFHAEHGLATASKVWDLAGFEWHDADYLARRALQDPLKQPMNIYEVHLGSWFVGENGAGDVDDDASTGYVYYRTVATKLVEYCRKMGYTHVELLPVCEHPLMASWGYQSTGYYAVNSRYGTPQDFMFLVDTLHAAGIGVILDWVPAHFPKDDWALARFDGESLFEYPDKGEHPEWGTLVFDFGRPQVQSFLVSSALFFMDVYHADGIRVDAVSSMIYRNYGNHNWDKDQRPEVMNQEAMALLRKLNHAILSLYPGSVTIAEESTSYPGITRPPQDGGLGFLLKWDMGFMHDTLDYMELDPLFRSHNHAKLTFSMMYFYNENYVLPFSHDEVVHGKKSMLEKMHGTYDDQFTQLKCIMAYQYSHPGKKLNFMGSEFGQVIEWRYDRGLDWFLLDYPAHRNMQMFMAALGGLYTSTRALWHADHEPRGFAWSNVDNSSQSTVAFVRTSAEEDSGTKENPDILVCCNFTPVAVAGFRVGLPYDCTLTEVLTSSTAHTRVGSLVRNVRFCNLPFQTDVDIPPFTCAYFSMVRKPQSDETVVQNPSAQTRPKN